MEIPTFRARSVPELLDAAFQVLRRRYVQILLVTLLFSLPAIVLDLVLPEDARVVAAFLWNVLLNYSTAATVVIVSDLYLGRETSLGGVLRRVGERFGAILGAAVIAGLLIGVGVILCVLPGIYAFIVTFAMPMAVMLEGESASGALDRSSSLAGGQHLRILGTQALAYLLMFVALLAFIVVLGFVTAFGSETVIEGRAFDVVNNTLVAVVYPFPAVVSTLLYYDLRIRKEGFDIAMLMESAAGPAPDSAPA